MISEILAVFAEIVTITALAFLFVVVLVFTALMLVVWWV